MSYRKFVSFVTSICICILIFLFLQSVVKSKCVIIDTNNVPPYANNSNVLGRLIIVVVDALRTDYLINDNYCDLNARFILVRNTSLQQQGVMVIKRLYADPPTTTEQRLKALATGSIPPLIEVGDNFYTDNVKEDNWLRKVSDKLVLLGDDTWIKLFPDVFDRNLSKPIFSFGSKNHLEIDRPIIEPLFSILHRHDWKVLIAHFLGIDCCGHNYHVHHPEMLRKIHEMDQIISDIMKTMNGDDVLIVLGDHGMTDNGGHGGSTSQETNTAMFVYSLINHKHGMASNINFHHQCEEIDQIDIVPTICAILNISLPFSNLGYIIKDIIPIHDFDNSVKANIDQIHRYVSRYCSIPENGKTCKLLQNAYGSRDVENNSEAFQKETLRIIRRSITILNYRYIVCIIIAMISMILIQTSYIITRSFKSNIRSLSFIYQSKLKMFKFFTDAGLIVIYCVANGSYYLVTNEVRILFVGSVLLCMLIDITVYLHMMSSIFVNYHCSYKRNSYLKCLVIMIAAFFAFTAPLDTKFHTMTSDFVHFDFLNICILVVIVILIDFAFKVTLITSNTYIALLSVFLKQPCILIATVFPHFKRDENKVTTSLIAAINTLTISVMSSSTWPSTAFLLAFMDNFQALNLGDCILLLSVSDLFFYLTGHSNQYDKIKFKTGFRFDEYLPITRMTHSSQMTIRGLLVLSELYSARILSINNLDITKVTRSKSVLYYIFWIMSIKIIYSTISMTILIEHILITSIYFPYYIFNCVSYAITIILLCLKL